MVEQADGVLNRLLAVPLRVVRLAATAVPSVVVGYDTVILSQRLNDARCAPLHVNARAQAVNQQDRLALSLDEIANRHAVGTEKTALRGAGRARCGNQGDQANYPASDGKRSHERSVALVRLLRGAGDGAQHARRGARLVQDVEMDPGHAAVDERLHLPRGEVDAHLELL